jgi:hypothetical protein
LWVKNKSLRGIHGHDRHQECDCARSIDGCRFDHAGGTRFQINGSPSNLHEIEPNVIRIHDLCDNSELDRTFALVDNRVYLTRFDDHTPAPVATTGQAATRQSAAESHETHAPRTERIHDKPHHGHEHVAEPRHHEAHSDAHARHVASRPRARAFGGFGGIIAGLAIRAIMSHIR